MSHCYNEYISVIKGSHGSTSNTSAAGAAAAPHPASQRRSPLQVVGPLESWRWTGPSNQTASPGRGAASRACAAWRPLSAVGCGAAAGGWLRLAWGRGEGGAQRLLLQHMGALGRLSRTSIANAPARPSDTPGAHLLRLGGRVLLRPPPEADVDGHKGQQQEEDHPQDGGHGVGQLLGGPGRRWRVCVAVTCGGECESAVRPLLRVIDAAPRVESSVYGGGAGPTAARHRRSTRAPSSRRLLL
jgi:hypothetical protein